MWVNLAWDCVAVDSFWMCLVLISYMLIVFLGLAWVPDDLTSTCNFDHHSHCDTRG